MATPAQAPVTSAAVPAEPVPVAFIGRTSTLALQDPRASLNRQLRSARQWLPPGWFIAAVYWDIESGGIDLEQRSQGDAYKEFADTDLPRDGGMADLLREASSPSPEIRRRRLRGHRALRPRHVQRAETGKRTLPAGDSRYSPPTSPPTSKASTPPPYWCAGSSKASRNGTGSN